ncbi:MAG: energy-coupling factor transporter ATPase [Cyanobacteria bacterium P01_A01_bin.135]
MLTINNLSFSYPDAKGNALKDISLELERGRILGITGPTGAGKSTLCQIIAGFAPRFTGGNMEGSLSVSDQNPQDLSGREMAKYVGIVFADYSSQLTQVQVIDEVMAPLLNQTVPEQEARDRAHHLLTKVGLDPEAVSRRRTWELSGGQQQRVAIAAALAMEPELLIFDAATGMLDPKTQADLRQIIHELSGDTTLIVVEDDVNPLVGLADHLLVLNDGEVVAFGPAEELLRDRQMLRQTAVELPRTIQLAEALNLDAAPLSVDELQESVRNLDADQSRLAADRTQPDFGDVVLEADSVSYQYEDGPLALDDVSLTLCRGEVHAVIGGNGAGKSTLIKLLIGLYKPTSGSVTVLGESTKQQKVINLAEQVGVVYQNPDEQLSERTVKEELRFPLERRRHRSTGWFSKEERYGNDYIEARLQDAIARISLDESLLKKDPTALPMGQRKLVTIAAALMLDPKIVLLDEPRVSLDAPSRDNLAEMILQLKDEGKSVVIVGNDMDFIGRVADTVTVLREGKVVRQDNLHSVFNQSNWNELEDAAVMPPLVAQAAQRFGGTAMNIRDFETVFATPQEVA